MMVSFQQLDILRAIERLRGYQFELFVDGLEIRKSTFFGQTDKIRNEGEDFKVYSLPQFDDIVAERPLRFHGYIYTQRTKIKPTELQGILIRIKDVAIASYDKSILRYPRQEGPIFSMISGEVFVESGLEDALNMTRNDFNGTHPHYQKLQSVIHKFVREEMMQDIRKRSGERLKREREERLNRQLVEFPRKINGLPRFFWTQNRET